MKRADCLGSLLFSALKLLGLGCETAANPPAHPRRPVVMSTSDPGSGAELAMTTLSRRAPILVAGGVIADECQLG